jgi:hypothetical protein
MRSKATAIVCALIGAAALAAGGGTASAGLQGFENCGKVPDLGGSSPVKAANVRCERAVKLASAFIADDVLKPDWRTYNPAGCEFFMHHRGDRREISQWFLDGGELEVKAIYFIKTRGCES